ncbi:MAG: PorV/PorQ family protein, partial [Elusimicrobiota bacterium]
MRRRLAPLLCLLLLPGVPVDGAAGVFPEGPFSDKAAGTTGAAFLKIPTSARAQALGSAFVAAVDNSESMFWNPAGLARFEEQGESELSFGYSALLETSYAGTVGYARPFANGRGVLGAAFVYFSQASIQGFNTLGNPDGSFTPNDLAFSVYYAKKFERLSLGGGLKFLRSELADVSGSSFAVDFGIQSRRVFDLGEGAVDLGASIRNLGP